MNNKQKNGLFVSLIVVLIVVFISNPLGKHDNYGREQSLKHWKAQKSNKPIASRLDSPEELYQAVVLVVIAGGAWYFMSKDDE